MFRKLCETIITGSNIYKILYPKYSKQFLLPKILA